MLSEQEFISKVMDAEGLRLFLDYDGTLVEFTRRPDQIEPNHEVVDLLRNLVEHSTIHIAVVSGRPMEILEQLLPTRGLILAGTYGIELRNKQGKKIARDSFEEIRPIIEKVKIEWARIVDNKAGLQLEDKRWSIALHARWAEERLAESVIASARSAAGASIDPARFRLLGGHRFLEVAPLEANKGNTVEYLLEKDPPGNDLPLYIGDDDKDEEAFSVIKRIGGIPVVVASETRPTEALYRLDSPPAVRKFLGAILENCGNS
jgi:trehalose-phosphatase